MDNIPLLIGPLGMFYVPFLVGILAICLGIWHERKKKEEGRRRRGLKYLMFSVIGILSFFAGFYLGDEMHLGYTIFKSSGGPLNHISICFDNLYSFIPRWITYFEGTLTWFHIKGIWHILPVLLPDFLWFNGLWSPRALLCEIYKC